MAYGIINIRYGGAQSTKFVDESELYDVQNVPAGAQIDLYINMEEYGKLRDKLSEYEKIIQSSKDSYSNAVKRMQTMQNDIDKMASINRNLSTQLERANRIIDYMIDRSE